MTTETIWKRLRSKIRKGRNESGQAIVELALTMPVLIALLGGAVELARVAYAAIEVSNAARAGAQFGGQGLFYAQDSTGIQTTAQNDANDIYSINNANFTATSSLATICSDGSATSPATYTAGTTPTCSGSLSVEYILTVKTSDTFDPIIHFPGLPTSYTVRGLAVQKVLFQ
jgi:Flp pilus assembly protein TadG